jgi:DNA-binding GntR family transcriptional regulator
MNAKRRQDASHLPAVRAVEPQSLRQRVAASLSRDILLGVYSPGQRLVERELVGRFQVSAIPIREALLDLENQGLVVKRVNAGCSVVSLTADEAAEIVRFRSALEPSVVQWAADRMTQDGCRILSSKLQDLRDAAERKDLPAFFHADLEFHREIWRISGNRWAAQALSSAVGALFASGLTAATRTNLLDLRAEAAKHARLLAMLTKGDGVAAARCLQKIAGAFEMRVLPAMEASD